MDIDDVPKNHSNIVGFLGSSVLVGVNQRNFSVSFLSLVAVNVTGKCFDAGIRCKAFLVKMINLIGNHEPEAS